MKSELKNLKIILSWFSSKIFWIDDYVKKYFFDRNLGWGVGKLVQN